MKLLIIITTLSLLSCAGSYPNLDVVPKVDLQRYQGTWYEIARLPNSFEEGLKCITATYALLPDGDIKVTNRGISIKDNSVDVANGKAWIPNPAEPGKLKVRFFWPFAGDYWIITLDENYNYVLIGTPSRKYCWILARDKSIGDDLYSSLTRIASEKGFDTTAFIKVRHDCDQ
jgi:lipocalin